MRVCIAAGGTGGHLLPGLSAARELRKRGHQAHFTVKTDGVSQGFLAREGFASSSFFFAGFPRRATLRCLSYPFLTAAAFLCARRVLRREKPDVVLGMGGFVSVPLGLAALALGVPLVIHEQNALMGMANRFLGRWARAVALTFDKTESLPSSLRAKSFHTGLPLRADLLSLDGAQAREKLGLDPERFTVLVFGGSQGARALNRLAANAMSRTAGRKEWQFIHMTGPVDEQAVARIYALAGVPSFVKPYWNDMATLYAAADFVVARAGANTVMELARVGKRCLLIPFPFATGDHQAKNARYLEERGQAEVVREKDMSEERLLLLLERLPEAAALRGESEERRQALPPEVLIGSSRLADVLENAAGGQSPARAHG